MKFLGFAALAALGMISSANAATVVNIDSTANYSNATAIVLNLTAGTYNVTAINNPFESFTRFSSVVGCDGAGENCAQGYEHSYRIAFDATELKFGDGNSNGGIGPISPGNGYFATSAQAFATAVNGSFTLANDTAVKFYIFDDNISDNSGGISLSVAAVPEPATWAMMIAGFGLVGGAMRSRRRANVTFA